MAAGHLPKSVLLVGLAFVGGCSRVPGHQGFIIDQSLAKTVRAGVDNKASVEGTLGRPSFIGQFDPNDWYYVSRETRQLAFKLPKASSQVILHVRFDPAGNVASVDRAGMEKVASIRPESDRTATLGKNRSFFQELFGNIGQVGSVGQGGGTTDNPDGGN
jgi:outer membrane protein assembly factor BamE (lipoprotein component of BamABCDE complex)